MYSRNHGQYALESVDKDSQMHSAAARNYNPFPSGSGELTMAFCTRRGFLCLVNAARGWLLGTHQSACFCG